MEERIKLIAKAKKLEKEENFEPALKILEDLFEKDQDSKDVKSALIDVLLSYGGYLNDDLIMGFDKAFKCFQKVIGIDPLNYRAYYNLGIVYLNQGKMKEALDATNKVLEIKPDHKYSYYSIGLIYETMNELNKALEYYEKALKIDNKFVYALHAWNSIKQELNLSLRETPDFEKRKSMIEKLGAVLKMSKRIKIQMIQDILELDKIKTLELLIDWGKKYDCEIDGDYLTINKEKLPALLTSLNEFHID